MDAILDGAQPRVVHARRGFGLIDMHQHQHRAQQQTRRVGQVLIGAARRGAVDGFEHGAVVADIRRARDPHRPRDLRGHVGENVAIQIGHHDDVESLRRIRHLGGADVHDPVFVLDVLVLRGDFVKDLVEETVGHLHDVVFGEAGDLLAAVAARVLEGIAHDLLAAGPGDELQALHGARAELVLDAGVAIFFVLAHDHQVHARMQRVDERVVGNARPHVGV